MKDLSLSEWFEEVLGIKLEPYQMEFWEKTEPINELKFIYPIRKKTQLIAQLNDIKE
jgi:hypothetical protein